jgi:pyridoxal phosphate enzyme (YggS family)
MENSLAKRLEIIRTRISEIARRCGRKNIKLVAVSKTVSVERIQEAIEEGVTLFGENRVQEARDKWEIIKGSAHCHLIGHLQTNKVKDAVRIFQCIHSIDSLRLALEVNRRCQDLSKVMPVLVQVNIAGEESKFGIETGKVAELIQEIRKLDHLRLDGLMIVPPYFTDPEDSRPYFRRLAEYRNDLESA